MRRLIYTPVTHGASKFMYQKASKKDKPELRKINQLVTYFFDEIATKLLSISREMPIHKAYADSFSDFEITLQSVNTKTIKKYPDHHPVSPLFVLLPDGTRIMPTEHPALDFISDYFHDIYIEVSKLPVSKVLPIFRKMFENRQDWYKDLEELCLGERTFNITRLRDKYISNNINTTLQDGENGVIIMGEGHKVDAYLREMRSGIQIQYLRVFPR